MNITHHLADDTLSEYAAGTLNEALEVVVASHLTLCPRCRQRASFADSLGGHYLDSESPSDTNLSALDLLRRAEQENLPENLESSMPGYVNKSQTASIKVFDVPRPLARRLPDTIDSLKWSPMAPGIKQFNLGNLPKREGAFKLLKLDPGVELIEHTHGDQELTLVLRGSYSDAIGRFGVGDVADLDSEINHKPIVDSDEPCIALIATNSPAKYRGIVGKILQPFVGI